MSRLQTRHNLQKPIDGWKEIKLNCHLELITTFLDNGKQSFISFFHIFIEHINIPYT
jgi:hypothetical protein